MLARRSKEGEGWTVGSHGQSATAGHTTKPMRQATYRGFWFVDQMLGALGDCALGTDGGGRGMLYMVREDPACCQTEDGSNGQMKRREAEGGMGTIQRMYQKHRESEDISPCIPLSPGCRAKLQ